MFAFIETRLNRRRVTADELKKLEATLAATEDIFRDQHVYAPRITELRDELRTLVAKVVMERIRAEEREQSSDGGSSVQADGIPNRSPRILALERSVKLFEETTRNFERAHERMLANRRGASDSMMVNLDELMSANQQSLISVLRILATTRKELEQERRKSVRE